MTYEEVLEEIDNLPFNGYKPLQVPPLLNLQSAFPKAASAKNPLVCPEQYWPHLLVWG